MTFGEYLKTKRLGRKFTLRKMASCVGISAPYLSDIEKNNRTAPSKEKLDKIIAVLNLDENEKEEFFSLAGKSKDSVPQDIEDYIKDKSEIQILLRTMKKNNLSEKEIMYIIKDFNKR
jgi:transcriptional regulator with XRE-family HTH domain